VLSLQYTATMPLTEMAIERAILAILEDQTGDDLPRPFVVITSERTDHPDGAT